MFESWFCSEISSKWSELVDQPIWQVSPQLWGYCNKFNTHTLKLQVHVAQSTPIRVSNLKIAIAFTPDLQHLNKRGYSHLTKTFPQSSSHEINWLLPHCSIRGHIWNVGAFQSREKRHWGLLCPHVPFWQCFWTSSVPTATFPLPTAETVLEASLPPCFSLSTTLKFRLNDSPRIGFFFCCF